MEEVIEPVQADFLSSVDLQNMTGIASSTWRYWNLNQSGPPSFKLGRRRVWRRSQVLAWIADKEAASGSGGGAQ